MKCTITLFGGRQLNCAAADLAVSDHGIRLGNVEIPTTSIEEISWV